MAAALGDSLGLVTATLPAAAAAAATPAVLVAPAAPIVAGLRAVDVALTWETGAVYKGVVK